MGNFVDFLKVLLPILSVATAPLYEMALLTLVRPFPFNYVAAAIPPGLIAYYLYRKLKERESLFVKQIKSTWAYDMEKFLHEYTELLKKRRKGEKKA